MNYMESIQIIKVANGYLVVIPVSSNILPGLGMSLEDYSTAIRKIAKPSDDILDRIREENEINEQPKNELQFPEMTNHFIFKKYSEVIDFLQTQFAHLN